MGAFLGRNSARLLKSSVGLLLLLAGARVFVRSHVLAISEQAVVGGMATKVNAPVDGVLTELSVGLGQTVASNATLALLENPYADDQLIRELEIRIGVSTPKRQPQAQASSSLASLHRDWSVAATFSRKVGWLSSRA